MIYKITFMNDEVENFKRVFEADSDATFLELHKAILNSVGYSDDQMTSFFLCNEQWERGQEVTLIEMADSVDYENMTMETTRLSDLLLESKQRLIYVFDPMMDRYFFGSVTMLPGSVEGVVLAESKGKAPKQLTEDDLLTAAPAAGADLAFGDDEFFGDSEFDEGDIDLEGFENVSFDDGTMF